MVARDYALAGIKPGHKQIQHEAPMKSQYRVLLAHTCGWLLRFVGYWLAEWGHRIDAWAGIEPVRVGGTD